MSIDRRFLELEHYYYEVSEEVKSKILDKLMHILKNIDDIVFAYVHGSFIEEKYFRDIDIAIWITNEEKAFTYTLELSTKAGIETGYPIDIHVLNNAPLPFRYHVFIRGRLLFSRDEYLRSVVEASSILMYLDLKFHVRHCILNT